MTKSFQSADTTSNIFSPGLLIHPRTLPKSQHVVPDFISVFILEGEQSEKPQQELNDVDNHKDKQQFFGHLIVILPIVTVLHIGCNGQDLVSKHDDQADRPTPHHSLFHPTRYAIEASHDVNGQSDQANDQRRYS